MAKRTVSPGFVSADVTFEGTDLDPISVQVPVANVNIQMKTAINLLTQAALIELGGNVSLSNIVIDDDPGAEAIAEDKLREAGTFDDSSDDEDEEVFANLP